MHSRGRRKKIFHFIVSTVGRTSCSFCCCWPQRLNYSDFAFKAASLWLYTELSCSGSAARQPLTPSNNRPHEPNPLGYCQPNPFSNSTGKEQIPSRFLVLFDSKIGNGSVCKSMCHWIDQSRAYQCKRSIRWMKLEECSRRTICLSTIAAFLPCFWRAPILCW